MVVNVYSLTFRSLRSSGKQRRSAERSEGTMSHAGKHTIEVGGDLVGRLIGNFVIREIVLIVSLERRCKGCLVAAVENDLLLPVRLRVRWPYLENPTFLDNTCALLATANGIVTCL